VRQPIPFGKYVLLERISVGGMAEVFKAKAFGVEGFEKILAIKRILPSMAEDADFIEMFIDEAKICGQLNHANICQIFELGRVDDSHFIAMEYVWGKDVLQIQNRFRKLRQAMRPEMAAFIAAKLCEGLDYAHKKKDAGGRPLGIIHRDVSPQNILVSYDGELKIIDFGIAKAASRSSKTQAGVLKGKFGYMSPEQVRGQPLDRRSDVFAIGTILYELLTSDRLFIGESDFDTLEKVRNVDVPPVSTVNKSVPADLEAIITKALARDADHRYQWASEMQDALQAFLLSRDGVFTAKQLSAWMREQFVVEMKREQQILDEQRKIGRNGQAPSGAPDDGRSGAEAFAGEGTNILEGAELADLVLAAEVVGGTVPAPIPPEERGEPTTVSQPSFAAAAAASGAPLPEQSTQILPDNVATAPVPKLAGETIGRPAAPELPAQPTVILEGGTSATSLPAMSAAVFSSPAAQTLMADPSSGSMPAVALGTNGNGAALRPPSLSMVVNGVRTPTGVRPVTGRVVAPPPYAHTHAGPPRSTLWKDVAIGIVVAVFVVASVLGVRALLTRSTKGTLVVMVNAAGPADVFIDAALRGRVDPGVPLTLRDLPAGPHAVLVRGGDGGEFRQQVQLAVNDVAVLTASVRAPAPPSPGTGHVKLNIATEGAQVWVDGAELADGAWHDPIPLRADVAHEIRVTKPMREEQKLSVTLKAGESLSRDIELVPSYGRLTVNSTPPGIDVAVNGKRFGATPITVGDIDPGKPARVSLRRHGFSTVIKYVSFEHALEQTLDVKMMPGSSSAAAAAEDKPSRASRSEAEPSRGPTPLPLVKPPASAAAVSTTGTPSTDDGYLVANSQPWAKVIVDGKDTGKTTPIAPRSKIPLKPGKHVVTFVANGKKFNFDIVIKPGEDTRLIKQLADVNP
jgi:hypothetical protein